jgi:acetyl-CoA acetyltransferase
LISKGRRNPGLQIRCGELKVQVASGSIYQNYQESALVRNIQIVIYYFDKKINVNGSGISLGHPVGATGAMRLVGLLHEMKRRGSAYGLETICGGGELGIAAVFELS